MEAAGNFIILPQKKKIIFLDNVIKYSYDSLYYLRRCCLSLNCFC